MVFQDIGELVLKLPEVKTLVYSAGYLEEGRITELSLGKLKEINTLCYEGLVIFMKKILHKQEYLDELITASEVSLAVEIPYSAAYSGSTAAAEKFSEAMTVTGEVGRVIVANYFKTQPAGAANHIMAARENEEYRHKYIKIYREPPVREAEEVR